MAAIVLGPALGGLVGAAVYYTISQTITDRTLFIRSELHTLSTQLTLSSSPSSSFTTTSPQPQPQPPPREPLSSLLKSKWNQTLSSLVHTLETSNIQTINNQITTLSSVAGVAISDRLHSVEDKVGTKLKGLKEGGSLDREGILLDPGSELGAEVFFDGLGTATGSGTGIGKDRLKERDEIRPKRLV